MIRDVEKNQLAFARLTPTLFLFPRIGPEIADWLFTLHNVQRVDWLLELHQVLKLLNEKILEREKVGTLAVRIKQTIITGYQP